MRYHEIFEDKAILANLKSLRKDLKGQPNIIWHECGHIDAEQIWKSGFQTGLELQKGEVTGSIYFTDWAPKGVSYVRNKQKKSYIPVDISNLNIVTDVELSKEYELSDLSPTVQKMIGNTSLTDNELIRYQIKRWVEDGIFPKGVDGVRIIGYDGKSTHELALSKEAANKGLDKIKGSFALNEVRIGGEIKSSFIDALNDGTSEDEYTTKPAGLLDTFELKRYWDQDISDETVLILICDKDKAIGWMSAGPDDDDIIEDATGTGLMVYTIFIKEEYRSQQIPTKMYQWFLDNYCDYLIAGSKQTNGGKKLWKRFFDENRFDMAVFNKSKKRSTPVKTSVDLERAYVGKNLVPWIATKGRMKSLVVGSVGNVDQS